jgi:hypothetical protein
MPESVFVIFAPGLGGNHFRNLLTLTPRFRQHCDFAVYQPGMTNAHTTSAYNLDHAWLLEYQQNTTGPAVLCGHIGEYLWLKQQGADLLFPNKKFIVIEFPAVGTVAYQRMTKFRSYYQDAYLYCEQQTLYTQASLESLFGEQDFFSINSEDIFVESVDPVVAFITQQLCTTIDAQQAQLLHSTWYSNVIG